MGTELRRERVKEGRRNRGEEGRGKGREGYEKRI